MNSLFEGDLTDQDKLVYVNNVIKGKLLESKTLQQQATNNTKEQFANSPDLRSELLNAIMGALDAHTAMSTQALNSEAVQSGSRTSCEPRRAVRGPARAREELIVCGVAPLRPVATALRSPESDETRVLPVA